MSDNPIFDLEQSFLACWGVTCDVQLLLDRVDTMSPDDIMNALIGIEAVYNLRFERAWKDFEKTADELRRVKHGN